MFSPILSPDGLLVHVRVIEQSTCLRRAPTRRELDNIKRHLWIHHRRSEVYGGDQLETGQSIEFEPHFTAFIDLLGFAEASTGGDDLTRAKVLAFLLSISSIRGEYSFQSEAEGSGTRIQIRPTISTFSDHIVISYPLKQIAASLGKDDSHVPLHVLFGFASMLKGIAAAALSIGFLIRGGATIGNLYHSGGIVFGEAMVKAYRLESRTAIYPRVVLSQEICSQPDWIKSGKINLRRGNDGLYYFNYYRDLVIATVPPGDGAIDRQRVWFANLNRITAENLSKLEKEGNMAAFSKWAWFANELYAAMSEIPEGTRRAFGLDIEAIPKVLFS